MTLVIGCLHVISHAKLLFGLWMMGSWIVTQDSLTSGSWHVQVCTPKTSVFQRVFGFCWFCSQCAGKTSLIEALGKILSLQQYSGGRPGDFLGSWTSLVIRTVFWALRVKRKGNLLFPSEPSTLNSQLLQLEGLEPIPLPRWYGDVDHTKGRKQSWNVRGRRAVARQVAAARWHSCSGRDQQDKLIDVVS